MEKYDVVNHPQHYQKGGFEVIDIIEGSVSDPISVLEGNVIKYILRYKEKNGVEDLKKANWYLKRLISKLEENNG